MGALVGPSLGWAVGASEGVALGVSVGKDVGVSLGSPVGRFEGGEEGALLGCSVGGSDATPDGTWLGSTDGSCDGTCDGTTVGRADGMVVGMWLGGTDGSAVGASLGRTVGTSLGIADGRADGCVEGCLEGAALRESVGRWVGSCASTALSVNALTVALGLGALPRLAASVESRRSIANLPATDAIRRFFCWLPLPERAMCLILLSLFLFLCVCVSRPVSIGEVNERALILPAGGSREVAFLTSGLASLLKNAAKSFADICGVRMRRKRNTMLIEGLRIRENMFPCCCSAPLKEERSEVVVSARPTSDGTAKM